MEVIGYWVDWIWDWLTIERVKTGAAIVQAFGSFGFIVAAYLTYKYASKLESYKFKMKLDEVVHTNTHKRRMECVDKISGLMGKVLAKLKVVPDFDFYNEFDPVPPQSNEALDQQQIKENRYQERLEQYQQATSELREAAEEGFIYIDMSLYLLIEFFAGKTQSLIGLHDFDRLYETPTQKKKQ